MPYAQDPRPAHLFGSRHRPPRKTVALTFDDGPGEQTPAVLDLLRRKGVHATFFVIGENARLYPDHLRRIVAEGHLLGNHTWDHRQLTSLDATGQAAELDSTSREIEAITGVTPCVMRPPYGLHTPSPSTWPGSGGCPWRIWSVDTEDWKASPGLTRRRPGRIRARAEGGGTQHHPMILFHDGGGSQSTRWRPSAP